MPGLKPGPRAATRIAFVVAGFASACWPPLTPLAKARLGLDDARFGLVLLAFGLGSLVGVGVAGLLAAQMGGRRLVMLGGFGMSLVLPALAIANSPWALGAALFAFGASLGTLDVAMNAHGAEVEAAAAAPLMSGFHALFSLGGVAGAGWITLLLRAGATPLLATGLAGAICLGLTALAGAGLLRNRSPSDGRPHLVVPKGIVTVIALLAATMFLVEGAVFDWSALLVIDERILGAADAGAGFVFFSVAMTAGRFAGDRLVARLGPRRVLRWGGALAILGLMAVLASQGALVALCGFLLLGLGAANVVPVLFSAAGRQTEMAPPLAVAAVTSTGYAGILAGPPLIGFIAQVVGLRLAFLILAALLVLVPALATSVTDDRRRKLKT